MRTLANADTQRHEPARTVGIKSKVPSRSDVLAVLAAFWLSRHPAAGVFTSRVVLRQVKPIGPPASVVPLNENLQRKF
jgi:hypothetical protein